MQLLGDLNNIMSEKQQESISTNLYKQQTITEQQEILLCLKDNMDKEQKKQHRNKVQE